MRYFILICLFLVTGCDVACDADPSQSQAYIEACRCEREEPGPCIAGEEREWRNEHCMDGSCEW